MIKFSPVTIALLVVCFNPATAVAENTAEQAKEQTITENGVTYRLQPLPAPFKLTDEEQAAVTKVLAEWERRSATFENYSCKYTCWVYDELFRREEICDGEFRIDKEGRYSISDNGFRSLKDEQKSPQLTRWVFDGKMLINYDESRKIVSRTPVPQDPKRPIRFPFVLQANAKELAEQYYIRIVKHDQDRPEIRLQFHPRTKAVVSWFGGIGLNLFSSRSDWRRFEHVNLILSGETFVPQAIQLHDAPHSQTSYAAQNPIVNAENTGDWFTVETPEGWRETKLPLFTEERGTTRD